MSKALCIVDMQDDYVWNEPHEKAIPRVIHEVVLAKRRKANIFILEYHDWGKTVRPIMDSIGKYPYHRLIKFTDGGGYELQSYALKNNLFINKIRLCGINRGFCVYATAKELKHLVPGISISAAVNATWCATPRKGLQRLARVCKLLYHGDKIDSKQIRINPKYKFTNDYDVDERKWRSS